MKQIIVTNKDIWDTPVTVQGFETVDDDGTKSLLWCNHAGAENDVIEDDYSNPFGADWYSTFDVMQCDKCEAYQLIRGEFEWMDAPVGGVR